MSSSQTFPSFNVVVVGSYNADLVLSCDPHPNPGCMIAVAKSANSEISAELVRDATAAINAADLVFTQFEISPEAVIETAELCSHSKKRLALHASPIGPRSRLPEGEIFLTVLSIREALALAETREVSNAIYWLHDRGSQNLVLVDGDQSITFSNQQGKHTVPIPRGRRVLYSALSSVCFPGQQLRCWQPEIWHRRWKSLRERWPSVFRAKARKRARPIVQRFWEERVKSGPAGSAIRQLPDRRVR
jgi:hypothetical protein